MKKWRKALKISTIFVVILLAIAAVCYRIFGISDAAATYSKNLDAAKRAGFWFDNAAVMQRMNIPESDNGLLLLRPLMRTMEEKEKQANTKTADELFELRWSIVEPSLPLVEQAVDKPHLGPKFDLKEPYEGYKEFGPLRTIFSTLVKGIDVFIKKGQTKNAQKLLMTASVFAAHLRQDLMRPIPAINAADDVEGKIRKLIPRFGHDPAWLAVMTRALAILDLPWDLHDHLKFSHWESLWGAERLLGRTGSLEDLGLKREDSRPTEYTLGKLMPGFAAANLSRIHEYYVDILNRLPKDPNDFVGIAKVLQTSPSHDYKDLSYKTLNQIGDSEYQFGGLYETERAQRNVLRQAITVLQSRLDLSQGLPLKGFSMLDRNGKPLGLEHLKGGWIIYSVGPNGKDDHSVPPPAYVDDFIVHLSTATLDPKDTTRQAKWSLGAGGV